MTSRNDAKSLTSTGWNKGNRLSKYLFIACGERLKITENFMNLKFEFFLILKSTAITDFYLDTYNESVGNISRWKGRDSKFTTNLMVRVVSVLL